MGLNHEERVIAGVLPSRRINLLFLLQNLTSEHFRQTLHRNLFSALAQYFELANGVLPPDVLGDLLARGNVEAAASLSFVETYRACYLLEVSDEEFRYSVFALKDQHAQQRTGEVTATAFEMLERGVEVKGEVLRGHEEARAYALREFSEIDRMERLADTPEGDMRHEVKEVLQEYLAAQQSDGQGVLTGIAGIDKATGGFHLGELALIAAFTNTGKSNFCAQVAWHTHVVQGKNVFFGTSETVRSVVRRRIVARHSELPQFGLARPLNAKDIRDGSLGPQELAAFKAVLVDLDRNPDYGKCYIAQVPRGATLSYFESRMNAIQTEWNIDLSIMDSLNLLRAERKRDARREELNDILMDAKTFATSFNKGVGVPLLSPWQIKRDAYEDALRTGYYQMTALSDTSEAEKSPDWIMTLFRTPDMKAETVAQFLKMRDGDVPEPLKLEIDLRAAVFRDRSAGVVQWGERLDRGA